VAYDERAVIEDRAARTDALPRVAVTEGQTLKGYGHPLGDVQNAVRGAFGFFVSLEDRIARASALQDQILVYSDPLLGMHGIRDPEDAAVHCARIVDGRLQGGERTA
jgi:hypothetical protein